MNMNVTRNSEGREIFNKDLVCVIRRLTDAKTCKEWTTPGNTEQLLSLLFESPET